METYEIPFGTEKHKNILNAILGRYRLSKTEMEKRHEAWREADEQFLAYLPVSANDALRETARKSGKPQLTALEIPYSYAMLLTAHTYWTSVFLSRNPILQFTSRHGAPEQSTQALEALLDYQGSVGGMLVPFYVWLLDPGKYGLGILGTYWEKEESVISQITEEPVQVFGITVPGKKKKVRKLMRQTAYEGNKVFNVRPYDFYPDPRVSIAKFQEGEFCGRLVAVGWNTILKREAQKKYSNIAALKLNKKSAGRSADGGSPQVVIPDTKAGYTAEASLHDMGYVDLLEMTIELVPRDWDLGNSPYPEKWTFTVAEERVILGAQPQGLFHNKFPFSILEYEVDGYSLHKRGMLEVVKPLQNVMTWLINTHFFNVRKALNEQFVVDPSRVVMRDITDPNAGKLIRLKPSAYGTNPQTVLHQLQVSDVTAGHMRDAEGIGLMMQRMTGVSEQVMGMLQSSGRKTAQEVRTSSSFGVNRLKTSAEYFSAMGWSPLAQQLVQNTQQLYAEERMYKIVGDLLDGQAQHLKVTPDMLAGFFDFVPVDGTMPIDRFAQSNLWRTLLADISKMPAVAQRYDIGRIFSWVAQLSGLKNIKQFEIKVVPDALAQRNAELGNSIPLGGNNGGGDSLGLPGGEEALARVPESGQLAGLGASG